MISTTMCLKTFPAVYDFLRLHYIKHLFKENYGSEAKQSNP